jgi:2-polyprenyl-3-methyl-5-hydroxy-6-metoxy-1,4-benzoquinol methylase
LTEVLSRSPATPVDRTLPQCPLCATPNASLLFEKDAYPVYQCRNCRGEFLHPQPDDAVLASIYGPEYFLGGEGDGTERVARMKAATAQRYLSFLTRRLKNDQRRLLEIGCGAGELLAQAQQQGFEVRGVEVSPSSTLVANNRLGRQAVEAGTLETANVPPQHFDVIVGCDVVEHVRNPQAFLARVYECLKPGGMVFLITPSPDSLSRKVLGRHWMEYKTEHLFYFSNKSLKHLLSAAGFKDMELAANAKVLSFDYVNQHFQRFSVPGVSQLLRAARALVPDRLAFRHFTVPASGVLVMAWKPKDRF